MAEYVFSPALHRHGIGVQELLVMHFKELEHAGQLVNTFGDVQAPRSFFSSNPSIQHVFFHNMEMASRGNQVSASVV